ncbi:uncharacterized protein LOC117210612 [Bombus bifarius]|uniref:Uncharacterized protein LOC117210612 n=1 Tax=Bombus bifarius TaxID=103933 RepID=A0A6P8MMX2_9HYME|nr:uncharacterized protein LOC117210612 [Bombus bifarius]
MRLDKYIDSALFFSDFEKLINELKSAGAQVKEKKKLNYMLNTLPEEYSYIGYLINTLKEEDQTEAYVKNKIEIAEKKNKFDQGEMKTNAFAAKKGECFKCGKVGHFARRSKREAVTVVGMGQHVVAAEEEKTEAIRAGDVETSIVNQQRARASRATQEQAHGWQGRTQHTAAR